jgi:hypothetical protein
VLGLTLHFLSSPCQQWILQEIFGLGKSSCSDYIRKGLEALHQVLKELPAAAVTWPKSEYRSNLCALINRREPCLTGVFGFVDGLNLDVEEPSDPLVQNAYYNGWESRCVVSQLFVWGPDGTILYASLNNPGSMHDSAISRPLYRRLSEMDDGFAIVAGL